MNGESIFARMAAGKAGAVAECQEQFGALVWFLSRRFSDSETDAEDAAQEIMICLWQSAARYDASMGSEATFVATIARRRLIDRRRRVERRIRPGPLTAQEYNVPLNEGAGKQGADQIDGAERHAEALTRLSSSQQRVLRLSIGGLTHEQIAKVTAEPLGTVKTNIRRGLIRLREMAGVSEGPAGAEQKRGRGAQMVARSAGTGVCEVAGRLGVLESRSAC